MVEQTTEALSAETLQQEANRRTVDDVFRLWINPEVERRREAGLLTTPYPLEKAQIVLHLDRPAEVRLNGEVKAVMLVKVHDRAKSDVGPGKPVHWDQIEGVADVRLTGQDPNAAHITLLSVPGKGFGLFFDFRYNGARVSEHLEAAEEFFASAVAASALGHRRSFAENLFAATELTAKAMLLLSPSSPDLLKSKKHSAVASKLNQLGRYSQNVDRAFVDLHNELERARPKARYVAGSLEWTADEMASHAKIVRSTMDRVRASAPKRAAKPSTAS